MQRDVKIGIVIGVLLIALVAIFWLARNNEGQPVVARNEEVEAEYDLGPSEDPVPPLTGADSPFIGSGPVVSAPVESAGPVVGHSPTTSLGDGAPPPEIVRDDPRATSPGQTPITPPIQPIAQTRVEPKIHTVVRGDTLGGIAKHYYGKESKWKIIQVANQTRVPDPSRLKVGVKLVIPPLEGQQSPSGILPVSVPISNQPAATAAKRTHTVAPNETLTSIATKYYGSSKQWQRIHKANLSILPDPNRLQRGMVLVIPPKTD